MREIKFRIFDGKAMSPCVDLRTMIESFAMVNRKLPEDVHVMQFTGLHDKNGKEIYEGDFVNQVFPATGTVQKGEVIFNRGRFCLNAGTIPDDIVEEISEVIGNIHENPEILAK
jgi:hypothetical protein